ncbi:hypothetical protein QE374_001273 [Microbacterium sp. SORGH_AS428]|uniref:hypothetical protein n=1 Tax=Microbacterium sp. SORGH_AS_0428 TaxID=3041788 RepID=UPI002859AC74|nr:hypothetical protein [Microbacterium sp. SORGH_AS_0428]MDR6199364.1 hypothetical protein [Microbacterium sp. SORGH_AS_0428]
MTPARTYAETRRGGVVASARRVARIWWGTLTSGRFFSGWSAAVSLLIAVTVLGAYRSVDSTVEFLPAIAISVLVWALLVVLVLPVAWAERRMRRRRWRALLVLAAVVGVGAARPLLNDAAGFLLLHEPSTGSWVERITTNVVIWLIVLSLVATATVAYEATRDASARLRVALSDLSEADRRADAYARRSRILLHGQIARLRTELAQLVATSPGFDDVSGFSQSVRAVSHDLEDEAALPMSEIRAGTGPVAVPAPARRPLLARLRPPSPVVVSIAYAVGSLPYTLTTVSTALALFAVVLVFACGFVADAVARRSSRRRSATARGGAILFAWFATGVLFSSAAILLAPQTLPTALVPILAFPLLAAIIGVSSDAIHSAIVQTRRLSRALAAQTDAVAARTTRARLELRAAAEQLHGRVQGRCVLFAATVDERAATVEELDAFAATITLALAEIEGTAPTQAATAPIAPSDALAQMIETWSHVLEISSDIDDEARIALGREDVTRRVVDIASEGFLNAVKHSGARQATLEVTHQAPDAPELRVEVSSPGRLGSALPLTAGRGIANLGGAHLFQRGRDVVLEARVPLPVA